MFYSGFADEAADGIDGQIEVTKRLGWNHIELRAVEGTNVHDLPESRFGEVAEKLQRAGIRVNCLGSNIANWGTEVEEPLDNMLAMTERAIARMKALGTRQVRVMSFKVLEDETGRALEDQKEELRFEKLRAITERFTAEGLVPVHENCHTYGGMSWEHTRTLISEVPGMKLVFDVGNTPLTADFRKPYPYPRQSSLEFYRNVKDHVMHVHIKDARYDPADGSEVYTFPGDGGGEVPEFLSELFADGYDACLSIEPHMAVVYHDPSVTASEDNRKENYVEYGRRLMSLVDRTRMEAR